MHRLSHIFVFPIKSLDGVSVNHTTVLQGGSLAHDREFVIIDRDSKWVNGKRTAKIHQIRSQFNLNARVVTLSIQGNNPVSFHLDHARPAIAAWLSQPSARHHYWVSRRSHFTRTDDHQHHHDRAGCFLVSQPFS